MKTFQLIIIAFSLPRLSFATMFPNPKRVMVHDICSEYKKNRYVFSGEFIEMKYQTKHHVACLMKFKVTKVLKAVDYKVEENINIRNEHFFYCYKDFLKSKEQTIILSKLEGEKDVYEMHYSKVNKKRKSMDEYSNIVRHCHLKLNPYADKNYYKMMTDETFFKLKKIESKAKEECVKESHIKTKHEYEYERKVFKNDFANGSDRETWENIAKRQKEKRLNARSISRCVKLKMKPETEASRVELFYHGFIDSLD